MTRVALKGLASRPAAHVPDDAGHRARRRHGQRGVHAHRHACARAADSLSSAAYDGTDAVVSARTAFEVDIARTTRSRSRRSTPRCSPRCAPSRRSAPRSATSPTRRRSSATTASPSATARTSATGFDAHRAGAEKLTAVPPAGRPLGDRRRARSSSTPPRPRSSTTSSATGQDHHARRAALVPRSSASRASARQVARHGDHRGVRPGRPRSSCSTSRAATTRSSSPAGRARAARTSAAPSRPRSAPAPRSRPRPRTTASRSTG